jgi:hypothetical protein
MDVIEGDPGYWTFLHSHLIAGEKSLLKLAVMVALSTRHFTADKWHGECRLFPDSDEAMLIFGSEPITVDQFRLYLENQLLDLEIFRVYIYQLKGEDYVRVGVAFDPAAMRRIHQKHVEASPQSSFRLLGTMWRLPDTLDPPTLIAELTKIVRFAQVQHGIAAGAQIDRSNLGLLKLLTNNPWGDHGSEIPKPPWNN